MCWDLVISVVSKVVECLLDPVGRQIGYVFNYNTNINNLKNQVEKLTFAKERVQIDVNEAIKDGEEVYPDVLAWLESVDRVFGQAEQITKDKEDKAKTRCFKGRCPDLKTRYQLSKKAKQVQVAVETQGEGKFEKVSYRSPLQVIKPVKGFEAFESRASILNNIMEALRDADVNLIGLYGMSGIGKTMLAKEVAFRVKEEGMLKSVVMITVTHQLEVKKIQEEIAEKLDFKIDSEFIEVRATRLSKRIKGEEKCLVILDDIWKAINLEEVGIPYGNDHKGCKILMMSRNQNVLVEMDVQRDFRLEILNYEEAWNLFQKTVGDFKDSDLQSVASDIAERCLGLPILIVTVASALKRKESFYWNDALEKLKRFDHEGIQDRVYKALELSYNFLGPDEKSLFCLCGKVTPHDIHIQDLLKYSMGLDLFKQYSTVKTTRQRLLKVISDLKRCCLLLEGEDKDHVQMHDAVHSFALSIAINDHRAFIIPEGRELEEWPEEHKFKEFNAISFPYCKRSPSFLKFLNAQISPHLYFTTMTPQ